MLFRVLGIENVTGDFKGNSYSGRNVYAQYPDNYQNDRLTGVKVERLWVPDRVSAPIIRPGDDIEVYYNKYGKVDSVQVV